MESNDSYESIIRFQAVEIDDLRTEVIELKRVLTQASIRPFGRNMVPTIEERLKELNCSREDLAQEHADKGDMYVSLAEDCERQFQVLSDQISRNADYARLYKKRAGEEFKKAMDLGWRREVEAD